MVMPKKWGTICLAAFLILTGLIHFQFSFPQMSMVLGALAIAAGVLLVLDK